MVTKDSQVTLRSPAESGRHKQTARKYEGGGDPLPQDPNRLSLLQEDNNTTVANSVVKLQWRRGELRTTVAAKHPPWKDQATLVAKHPPRNNSGKVSAREEDHDDKVSAGTAVQR